MSKVTLFMNQFNKYFLRCILTFLFGILIGFRFYESVANLSTIGFVVSIILDSDFVNALILSFLFGLSSGYFVIQNHYIDTFIVVVLLSLLYGIMVMQFHDPEESDDFMRFDGLMIIVNKMFTWIFFVIMTILIILSFGDNIVFRIYYNINATIILWHITHLKRLVINAIRNGANESVQKYLFKQVCCFCALAYCLIRILV